MKRKGDSREKKIDLEMIEVVEDLSATRQFFIANEKKGFDPASRPKWKGEPKSMISSTM